MNNKDRKSGVFTFCSNLLIVLGCLLSASVAAISIEAIDLNPPGNVHYAIIRTSQELSISVELQERFNGGAWTRALNARYSNFSYSFHYRLPGAYDYRLRNYYCMAYGDHADCEYSNIVTVVVAGQPPSPPATAPWSSNYSYSYDRVGRLKEVLENSPAFIGNSSTATPNNKNTLKATSYTYDDADNRVSKTYEKR